MLVVFAQFDVLGNVLDDLDCLIKEQDNKSNKLSKMKECIQTITVGHVELLR